MTKEELKEYIYLKKEREQIAHLLEELEAEMTAPSIQKLTGMPHAPSANKSSIEVIVARHVELVERYQSMIAKLDATQAKIEAAIESLNGVERTLMRHKYIEGMTWEEVCVAMSYSWRRVHQIHAAALQKLRKGEETPE